MKEPTVRTGRLSAARGFCEPQAFRRGSPAWLLSAILYHGAVNAVGIGLLRLAGGATPAGILAVEVAIMLLATAVLWWAFRLRGPEDEPRAGLATGARLAAPGIRP